MSPKLLVATRNPGKEREIRGILADLPYDLVFLDEAGIAETSEEALIEQADTFEGNARHKAEYFAKRSGLPTVAEDSGIEVFALGGLPGVKSRRFAMFSGPMAAQDEENNRELLHRLSGLAPDLFFSDDLGMSFGEASPEAKHAVSHRGRAFRAFAEWIRTQHV
jgi:XTP/dITP diphosphohydrolase